MSDQKYVSLIELADNETALVGFNADADANATIPPIPAQDYIMQLAFQESDVNKRWMQTVTKGKGGVGGGAVYFFTNIVAEVAENPQNPEKYWGRKVFHRVQTLIMQETGTNGIQAIMQALGKGERLKNVSLTHGKQAALLTEEMQANPLIIAEVDWEARRYEEGKPEKDYKVRGYKRFDLLNPADPNSIRNHAYALPDGDIIEARAIIARWKSLSKVASGPSAPAPAAPKPQPMPQASKASK